MTQDIYSKLGFKKTKNYILSSHLIDQARDILNEFPLRNVAMRQLIIEENLFAESFAISTAEDSDLDPREARKIKLSPEIEVRLIKYEKDKTLSDEEKYRQLEYENIRTAEEVVRPMAFKDIDIEFLSSLHYNLTVGLDEYCKTVGHYKYHSGKLRQSNDIKVGRLKPYTPPKHTDIKSLLKLLTNHFASKKAVQLADIFEFTLLLYAIHPFANGNKRVVRLIESMLIKHYGYGLEGMLSMAVYYNEKKESFHFFLMKSLQKKDPELFVNFALRGYLITGLLLVRQATNLHFYSLNQSSMMFLEKFIPKKYQKRFEMAFKVIHELGMTFHYTDFVQSMKTKGFSTMISRQVVDILKERQIVKTKGRQLSIGQGLKIRKFAEKYDEFLFKNEIYDLEL